MRKTFLPMLNHASPKAGFTLIELLVTIAIIALLSSIVLAAVSTSKIKAVQAGEQIAVHQFVDELEMVHAFDGNYPDDPNEDLWHCLGYYSSGACWGRNDYPTDTIINNQLLKYVPNINGFNQPVIAKNGYNYNGILYRCYVRDVVTNNCTQFQLVWVKQGSTPVSQTSACVPGDVDYFNWQPAQGGGGNVTKCELLLNN